MSGQCVSDSFSWVRCSQRTKHSSLSNLLLLAVYSECVENEFSLYYLLQEEETSPLYSYFLVNFLFE